MCLLFRWLASTPVVESLHGGRGATSAWFFCWLVFLERSGISEKVDWYLSDLVSYFLKVCSFSTMRLTNCIGQSQFWVYVKQSNESRTAKSYLNLTSKMDLDLAESPNVICVIHFLLSWSSTSIKLRLPWKLTFQHHCDSSLLRTVVLLPVESTHTYLLTMVRGLTTILPNNWSVVSRPCLVFLFAFCFLHWFGSPYTRCSLLEDAVGFLTWSCLACSERDIAWSIRFVTRNSIFFPSYRCADRILHDMAHYGTMAKPSYQRNT